MARLRKQHQPWGDGEDTAHYHDLRRGAMDDAFWDTDELVDHRKRGKKKKYLRGCPGNDGNEHVYVDIVVRYRLWTGRVCEYTRWVCCGCEKLHPRR